VGKSGTFHPSGNPGYDTTAADIDAMLDGFHEKNLRRLVLYFHGGLVSADSGMDTAARITRYVTDGSTSHPVSFVWETGLAETVKQNFSTIAGSDFFKKLLVKIIRVAGKQLGIDLDPLIGGSKGVGNMSDAEIEAQLMQLAPFDDTAVNPGKRSPLLAVPVAAQTDAYIDTAVAPDVTEDINEEIQGDPAFMALAAAEKPAAQAGLMKDGIFDTPVAGQKGIVSLIALIKAGVKVVLAVIKRHMKKRDHGFYSTIIEEIFREVYIADIGSGVWGFMKEKAANIWATDDFSGNPPDWHAGTYFLKKLTEYQKEKGPLTIDLVGHSAGAIVICELFKAVAERGLGFTFRKVIFMAPACRCELFSETVLKNPALYTDLRIFTMSDANEVNDRLLSFVYPRSLLYFISGLLEKDEFDAYILGLERHITNIAPYDGDDTLKAIAAYLKTDGLMIYSATLAGALQGCRSGSLHHGDFDNDKESTLDSIVYLIKP
jgi:hypothetical protein